MPNETRKDLLAQVKERCLAERSVATRERFDKFIQDAADTWHARMITVLRNHWWSEIVGDLETTMATLIPDPTYKFYGGKGLRKISNVTTTVQTRAMYASLYDAGYFPGGVLEDMRIACGDRGVMLEATLTNVLPGAAFDLPDMKIDPKAAYQNTCDSIQSQPFDRATGLMQGEVVYMSDIRDVFAVR
jgi:hypothetical protein